MKTKLKILSYLLLLFTLLTTSLYAADDTVNSISGPAIIKHGEVVTLKVDYVASEERVLAVYLKTTTGVKKNHFYKRVNVDAGAGIKQITFTVPDNAPTDATYKYGVYIASVGGFWSVNLGSAYQQGVKVEEAVVVNDTVRSITGPATISIGEEVTLDVDYVASKKRVLAVYLKTTTGVKKNHFCKRVNVDAGAGIKQITFTVPDNAPTDATYKYGSYIAPLGKYWKDNPGKAYQYGVKVQNAVSELNTWYNTVREEQSESVEATFTAAPSTVNINSVIGFSNGEAHAYSDLGLIVRFAPNGQIDARNGDTYEASNEVTYESNKQYTFRLDINFNTKKYSIYVTPANGEEILIGENYNFRSEQSGLTSINNMAHYSSENGTVNVGEVSFTGIDTTPPVITLTGDATVTITVGDAYTDEGVSATDDMDGNVEVTTTGTVDTNTVGTYIITYSASDTSNNIARVTRTVIVTATNGIDTTVPIWIIGDSTVSNFGYEDENGIKGKGWGQVINFLLKNPARIYNRARPGASSKSFMQAHNGYENRFWGDGSTLGYGYPGVKEDIQTTDTSKGGFLFIQFGHNDGSESISKEDYKSYMRSYIDYAHLNNLTPVLISPMGRMAHKLNWEQHEPYTTALAELSEEKGVPYLNLRDRSKTIYDTEFTSSKDILQAWSWDGEDPTHTNKDGATRWAKEIAKLAINSGNANLANQFLVATTGDSITSISGPASVTKGQEVTVTVDYTTEDKDLVVQFKLNEGEYTNFYQTVISATENGNSVTFTIPNNTPENVPLMYQAYLTEKDGGWSERVGNPVRHTGISLKSSNDHEHGKLILNENFSDWEEGPYTEWKIMADFQNSSSIDGVPNIVKDGDNKVLEIKYTKGEVHVAEDRGFQFFAPLETTGAKEVTLEYSVLFKEGFDWALGGKLPGLAGGVSFSDIPHGSNNSVTAVKNGFSARFMWGNINERGWMARDYGTPGLLIYTYYPGMDTTPTIYGESALLSTVNVPTSVQKGQVNNKDMLKIKRNVWYKITQKIILNDSGKSNGSMKVFINDTLAADINGMKWVATGNEYGINTLFMSTFYGGNDGWEPLNDSYTRFKNFKVWTK